MTAPTRPGFFGDLIPRQASSRGVFDDLIPEAGAFDDLIPSPRHSTLGNVARGAALGLAKAGSGIVKGVGGLTGSTKIKQFGADLESDARVLYDPEGTAGKVGEFAGRVLGEGATTLAGGGAIAKGLTKVAPRVGAKLAALRTAERLAPATASRAARVGSSLAAAGKRVAGNVLPVAPVDFALGAGRAGPGESAVGSGLKEIGYDIAGAGALDALPRAAKGAVKFGKQYGPRVTSESGAIRVPDVFQIDWQPTPSRKPWRVIDGEGKVVKTFESGDAAAKWVGPHEATDQAPFLRRSVVGPESGAVRIGRTQAPSGYAADPDVGAVLGTIATGKRAPAKPGTLLTGSEKAYTHVVDEVFPLRKFGATVGGSSELSDVATASSGWRGAAGQRLEQQLKPALAAVEGHADGVMALTKAQRGLQLMAQGVPDKTGLPREVLESTVEKLSKVPEVAEGAANLQRYYADLLEYKHANGVISDDAYQAIKSSEDFYTPFAREFGEEAGIKGAGGGKFVNRGTGVRKMDRTVGASAKTVDPYEQAVLHTFETYRTVAKQRVSNVVAGIVEADPDAAAALIRRVPGGTVSKTGKVVEPNIGGARESFEVLDKDLYDAWASFDPQTQNLVVRALSPFKRVLQTTVTALPDFALANMIRDNTFTAIQYSVSLRKAAAGAVVGGVAGALPEGTTQERLARAGLGAIGGAGASHMVSNLARSMGAMRSIIKNDDVYQAFVREGGKGFGFYPRTATDAQKVLADLQRGGADLTDVVNPKSWWRALRMINEAVEEAPRVARFAHLTKAGATPAAGVAGARRVSLDFGQVGKSTKGLAASKAFWNAQVQGWAKLGQLLKNPKTYAVGAASITAPTVALWSINKDNPEYWDRPQWEKNLFWLVPKPSGGFVKIPKPFEIGFIFASVPERLLDYAHQNDPENLAQSLKDMAGNTFSGVLPIPTGIEPVLENKTNFDLFRGRPVVSRPDLPKPLQSDSRTSSVAVGVGKVTGQSPQQIDNILGMLGGVGRLGTDAADVLARKIGLDKRPLPPKDRTPFLARFSTNEDVTSDAEQGIYRRADRAQTLLNGARELEKRGDVDALREYVERYAKELAGAEDLVEAARGLREFATMKRDLLQARGVGDVDRHSALTAMGKARRSYAAAISARLSSP